MSDSMITPPEPVGTTKSKVRLQRHPLLGQGEPAVWLCGGMVALSALMILGLLYIVVHNGVTTFWPGEVSLIKYVELKEKKEKGADGKLVTTTEEIKKFYMGEDSREEEYIPENQSTPIRRVLRRTGNSELSNTHFTWMDDRWVAEKSEPQWAMVVERLEWGVGYGILKELTVGQERFETPEKAWAKYQEVRPKIQQLVDEREHILKVDVGELNYAMDGIRLDLKKTALKHGEKSSEYLAKKKSLEAEEERLNGEMNALMAKKRSLDEQLSEVRVVLVTTVGKTETTEGHILPANPSKRDVPLLAWQIVRMYPANQLVFLDKVGVYFSRWREYLFDDPREANMEGGVWPAIVGTVVMTMIMVIIAVPIGVIAAIYLREYAKQGILVSIIRVTVNNLAGVPSIVFGVFGFGFFVYGVGSFVDGGPSSPMVPGRWITLGIFALAVSFLAVTSTVAMLAASRKQNYKLKMLFRYGAIGGWVLFLGLVILLVATNPFFEGFFRARLPDPTFGKTALVWASLTLALLTLPVVIVATEEALAAVPKSLREASYGCGATKWQTVWRVVLPRAMPGVMTGAILAIARGAGEVAPLMLVGVIKHAKDMPVSLRPPFVHLDQSFMHLGFHIYDLGFQSPNSEAAKSMVYTTTLLLITIVVVLNLSAMWIRARLRKGYLDGHF